MKSFYYVFLLVFLKGLFSCNHTTERRENQSAWADSVAEHAFRLMEGPHPAVALAYIDSVYLAQPTLSSAERWKKYNVKANYYANYEGSIAKRQLYADSMFRLLNGQEDSYIHEYTQTLLIQADLLRAQKKYSHAFRIYYDGRKFAESHSDQCSMSDFSSALGGIMFQQGQYAKAIGFFKEAFRETSSCHNSNFSYRFIQPQGILNSIALCHEKMDQPDSALVYYMQAVHFIKSQESAFPEKKAYIIMARGVVEGNLGGAYAKLNRFKEAESHLRESIRINDQPGYAIEDAQTAKLKLARLYLDHNRLPDAHDLLTQLERDLNSGRGKSRANGDIWSSWFKLKWLYSEKVRDVAGAYRYLKRYYVFSDSLEVVNSKLKNADLNQFIRERQQGYQLSILQKENEIKSISMFAVVLFLLIAIGAAVLIGNYLKRSEKNVIVLQRINAQKDRALEALENSHKENNRIMKIIAHDLRNPIGAMTGMAELLLDEDNRSDDDQKALELIKTSGENSLKLVNNLLHLNGTVLNDLEKEAVNVADLVQYCTDMLQFQAQKKSQTIEPVVESITARINYEKMWRVLSNLISNAIKFSPVGATVTVMAKPVGRHCQIMVKDQGIGIPEALKTKIFDMFTSAKRAGTSGEESFGLGLSISKQIVDAHGGKLWFEANYPKGTTFIIDIPCE